MRNVLTRRAASTALAAAVALGAALPPTPAVADTAAPATPIGLHIAAVSASAFTITTRAATHARQYRLFADTVKSDVYVVNIAKAHRSALSSKPEVTIGGLKYSTAPIYYRVEALNGTRRSWSAILSLGLQPAAPTAVRIANGAAGTYLIWSSGAGTGFVITQATNAAMTQNRRNYTVHGQNRQFTPYGLTKNRIYYFQVRAQNASTNSRYSGRVAAKIATSLQSVRVMSYNILEGSSVGQQEGGQVVASWAARRAGVIHLITQTNPDLIAIQEGAAWVGSPAGYGGTRQVDDLAARLPGYTLADTEISPHQHGYLRTGNYVLFRTSSYRTVGGNGGHWDLGDSHTAAYQVVQNRNSAAKIVFISPHLDVGGGAALDTRRENEATVLLRNATALGKSAHASVIYAGDFNSDVNRYHAFDGPGLAMAAARASDAQVVAQSLSNTRYNSANLYQRTPPAFGQSIDHVYAPPGVAVQSFGIVLDLRDGKFVGTMPSDHNAVVSTMSVPE